MEVKTSYGYKSKQLARQKIANFIIKHYRPKERKDLTAFILPGYDESSNTSLELTQVIDPVGIKRENVVGVERNPKIYEKLKKADLGIKLYNMTDNDFFKRTKEEFNIISLDYTGEFTSQIFSMLNNNIFGKHLLKSPGILHTNFFGAREGNKVKDLYKTTPLKKLYHNMYDKFAENYLDIEDKHFRNLKDDLEVENYISKSEDTNKIKIGALRDTITDMIVNIAWAGGRQKIDGDSDYVNILESLVAKSFENRGIPSEIARFIYLSKIRPYFCENIERYRYISDVGSPMMTDIFLLSEHPESFDNRKYPIRHLNPENCCKRTKEPNYTLCPHSEIFVAGFSLSDPNNHEKPLVKRVVSDVRNVVYGQNRGLEKIKNRVFLGSSVVRPKKKFSKEQVYEMIEKGLGDSEILKKNHIKKTNLAAYKAWVTMRRQKNEILSRIIPEDFFPNCEELL